MIYQKVSVFLEILAKEPIILCVIEAKEGVILQVPTLT